MGITAKTVYCAKCANCMNNKLRLGMDEPGGYRWPCETCYAERLSKSNGLALDKLAEIVSVSNVLLYRYDKTFLGEGSGYVEEQMHQNRILRGMNRMLSEILNEDDAEKVKAIKKMYDDECFEDMREGDRK